MVFRVGGKKFHLLKLIGAFVLVGAALMVLANVYTMFWVASTIQSVNAGVAKTVMIDLAGTQITATLTASDSSTQVGMFLVPVAGIMFWSAILLVGGVIYRGGGIIVPIEEEERDLPKRRRKTKKKRKR